jgi:hypothetical protein
LVLLFIIIKNLLGAETLMDICLSGDFWNPSEIVTDAHNSELDKEFSEKKLKRRSLVLMPRVHQGQMAFLFFFIRSSGS